MKLQLEMKANLLVQMFVLTVQTVHRITGKTRNVGTLKAGQRDGCRPAKQMMISEGG